MSKGLTLQQLVAQQGAGWKLISTTPIEDTKLVTVQDQSGVGSRTENRGTGQYYVILQDPQGVQRALYLTADPDSPQLQGKGTGGVQIVRQSGVNDAPDAKTGNPPTNIYGGNLNNLLWNQAGALGDVPNRPNQPSASSQLTRLGANGQVIPAGDTTTKVVKLRDESTGTIVDLPTDPAGVVTPVGNNFYVVKPDGTAVLAVDKAGNPITKGSEAQAVNVPNIGLVAFDPLHPENSKVIQPVDPTMHAKDLGANAVKTVNGKTFVAFDKPDGGIDWQETSLPVEDGPYTAVSGGNDPRSPSILLVDNHGNTKSVDKPGWTPPPSAQAGSALTPDTTAPYVVTIGDDGKPIFSDNHNRITISEAQKQLIQSLGLKVADNTMSEKEAMDLIASQTQAMTAQANQQNAQANLLTAQTGQQRLGVDAAQQTLTGVNQAAQTGAGLLQNRVTAATGALNNVVGQLGGGNLLGKLPGGWGANLAGGLQEWVTGLGGGQPVYDSAAAMVNQANPAISGNPTVAQQAYTALRGYMDLYKAKTGQDWQPGQATPGGVGGAGTQFQAPTTVPGQQTNTSVDQALATQQQAAAQQAGNVGTPSTATLNAQGLMDNAQGRAMAANQVPVAAGGAPQYPGQINLAYQQGVVSPVGKPANLAASPMLSTTPTPMPMIPGVYSPYGPFMAPQTV